MSKITKPRPPIFAIGSSTEDYNLDGIETTTLGDETIFIHQKNEAQEFKMAVKKTAPVAQVEAPVTSGRKASPAKVAPAKEAIKAEDKKIAAKAPVKAAPAEEKKLSFAKHCTELLLKAKHTDEEIADILRPEHPDKIHCNVAAVKYYRRKYNVENPESELSEMVYVPTRNGGQKLVAKETVAPVEQAPVVEAKPAKAPAKSKAKAAPIVEEEDEEEEEQAPVAPKRKVVAKKA